MRISELGEAAGVPVPTIKYYIREGLLERGHKTAANQASYGQGHVERLSLIRSLREVAGLSVATIREVVAALDEPRSVAESRHIETALRSLHPPGSGEPHPVIESLLSRLGWQVDPGSAGYAMLERALAALDEHWPGTYTIEGLAGYADVARLLAEREIPDDWEPAGDGTGALTYAVLGTVLFEPVILALRRMAHVDRHRRLTGATSDRRPPPPGSGTEPA